MHASLSGAPPPHAGQGVQHEAIEGSDAEVVLAVDVAVALRVQEGSTGCREGARKRGGGEVWKA